MDAFERMVVLEKTPEGPLDRKEIHPNKVAHSIATASAFRDLPGGPVVKTPPSQCRGPGFAPWSGN